MKNILVKSAAIIAVTALAACTDPNSAGDGLFGSNASGNAQFEAGSADDPNSIAYFQQTVGDRVLFDVDQSSLNAEGRSVLLAQANWLRENQDFVAVIEGHADEQGTRQYNLALGARRANAAMEYLISQGVSSDRLKTLSYGKERPIEICSEEACYRQNRRAVTILTAGLTS